MWQIKEIEQVYIAPETERRLRVWMVINENDYEAQKRIFAEEARIIDALPEIDLGFELIVRSGRPLGEIVNPPGSLLFARP